MSWNQRNNDKVFQLPKDWYSPAYGPGKKEMHEAGKIGQLVTEFDMC